MTEEDYGSLERLLDDDRLEPVPTDDQYTDLEESYEEEGSLESLKESEVDSL